MHAIEPLTAEAFRPFGDVVEASGGVRHFAINYGHTTRFHDLADIDTLQQGGRTGVSVFRSNPLPAPLELKIMERHPFGSQLFMPLSGRAYLVVVAPAGELDERAIRIFRASGSQGVNYRAGTWHHFCLALGDTSDFLVVDRIGGTANCDEVELSRPIRIDAEALACG
jgi:ureidoglycolate lyase